MWRAWHSRDVNLESTQKDHPPHTHPHTSIQTLWSKCNSSNWSTEEDKNFFQRKNDATLLIMSSWSEKQREKEREAGVGPNNGYPIPFHYSTFFWYPTCSNFIFKISTKHSLQNPHQTSPPRLNLKFKILTKPCLSILTKIHLHNLCKTSAAKYWPNSSLRILPELQLQNLDETLCWKSEQKFGFITKPQLPSMQQTVANTILIINISNINNLNKFWVGIFTCQGHINQVY